MKVFHSFREIHFRRYSKFQTFRSLEQKAKNPIYSKRFRKNSVTFTNSENKLKHIYHAHSSGLPQKCLILKIKSSYWEVLVNYARIKLDQQ